MLLIHDVIHRLPVKNAKKEIGEIVFSKQDQLNAHRRANSTHPIECLMRLNLSSKILELGLNRNRLSSDG
jgi:hypothetical protein